jgi:capsular polysaccharide transport system ATP-binding protein
MLSLDVLSRLAIAVEPLYGEVKINKNFGSIIWILVFKFNFFLLVKCIFSVIEFKNVSKSFFNKGIRTSVIEDFSFTFTPEKNYAIVGANGGGKTTVINLISGSEVASYGNIYRKGKVSWPLGFRAGFNGAMTGIENIKFVSRIYGQNTSKIISFVYDFSDLREKLSIPIKSYSNGMKARLAISLSLAIDFNCYLVDEVIAVGDMQFKKKCRSALKEKFKNSFLIMASHSPRLIKDYCDCGLLLRNGKLVYYNSIDLLLQAYKEMN